MLAGTELSLRGRWPTAFALALAVAAAFVALVHDSAGTVLQQQEF